MRRVLYSTSTRHSALRAIVYNAHGEPTEALRAVTLRPLPPPTESEVRLRILLSPINPADLNVVQGVYPERPTSPRSLEPVSEAVSLPFSSAFFGGSEAVGIVEEVGESVQGLKAGNRVILDKSHLGAWTSHMNVPAKQVVKIDPKLSDVAAATMRINPPTALGMLNGFVKLHAGDWVIQNGANSQAVIQIAAAKRYKTINLIRNRPDVEDLKKRLHELGADVVLTYNELATQGAKEKLKDITSGKAIHLGLNCVGGRDTTLMAKFLGNKAHLVSYGAMSKQPLSLPTSLFIFRNLTAHGYWQSQWYKEHGKPERALVYQEISDLLKSGKLREPEHEVLTLSGSDEDVTKTIRDKVAQLSVGSHGKKVLLQWQHQ